MKPEPRPLVATLRDEPMKLLLNCDQVFDVLTRGPFPTGDASDEPVEHHLRACHECRRLAEALRPAVELMHESLGPDGAVDLPEYQGVLAAVEHGVAREQVATDQLPQPKPLAVRKLPRRQPRSRRRPDVAQFLGALRLVAAVVLVSALGTLLWGLATAPGDGARQAAAIPSLPAPSAAPIRFDANGYRLLTSLNLPRDCFPARTLIVPDEGQPPPTSTVEEAKQNLQCCTRCHSGGQAREEPNRHLVAVMSRSCVACHSL
jgi:hypothetical protein